jgi:hypothetical protein
MLVADEALGEDLAKGSPRRRRLAAVCVDRSRSREVWERGRKQGRVAKGWRERASGVYK